MNEFLAGKNLFINDSLILSYDRYQLFVNASWMIMDEEAVKRRPVMRLIQPLIGGHEEKWLLAARKIMTVSTIIRQAVTNGLSMRD